MTKKELHFDLLRKLEANPAYTQRALAKEMGISLGQVNYCINKLIDKGFVKFNNFKRSSNKTRYIYLLTPKGIEIKSKMTVDFLKLKMKEYELLKKEITQLQEDTIKLKSRFPYYHVFCVVKNSTKS